MPHVLVKLCAHKNIYKILQNFWQNFRQYFASSMIYFPAPKILFEKLHILCSPIFSYLLKKLNYNFAEVLKNVIFLKDSIFRDKIFA